MGRICINEINDVLGKSVFHDIFHSLRHDALTLGNLSCQLALLPSGFTLKQITLCENNKYNRFQKYVRSNITSEFLFFLHKWD